jgi:hypothetical protein
MTEIIEILIQILFILFIITFPITLLKTNTKSIISAFSLIDKLSINLIFLINILFFASILNINSKYILYLYVILIIFLYFYNLRKFNFKSIKIDYYFFVLLSFVILISIDIAHELYFAWDTQVHWFFKALSFFQNQKFENLKNFPVPDYPHLGTYIWSFFWKFPLNSFEYLGRITYAFIYVLSIFSITECLKVHVYEKIILAILLIFLTYNYELFSGLQDILIFSLILIKTKFIYYFFEKKFISNRLQLIIILLGITNILCWVKNEGIFYAFFLLFCIFITNNLVLKNKIALITGSLIIISLRIFIFNYYGTELDPSYFEFEKTLNFEFLLILEKIKIITFYLIIYFSQNPIYLLTIPVLIYIAFKYPLKNITKFVIYFLILNFSFIYLTYLFRTAEVEVTIRHNMLRIIFQTSGFYFLAIIILINNYAHLFKIKLLSKYKIKKY